MSANQYLRRAVELARDGDLKSALAEVKRALAIEPGHEKGLVFRFTLEARLMRRDGRFGDAAVRYHAVLALDPDNREARQMLRDAVQPAAVPLDADTAPRGMATTAQAQVTKAAERWSDRPTVVPPAAAALVAKALSEVPKPVDQPTHTFSSAPPMVEVVTLRKERGVGSPFARINKPAKPLNASNEATVQSAVEPSPKVVSAPEPAQASAPLDVAEVEAPEAVVERDDPESRDDMPDDLPPPSIETPLEPERRVARRVSIEVDVGVSSESNFFTGFSGDISEGGLFIATYNLVPLGSHVRVEFGVMGREIACDATVCWIRDPIDMNLMPGFGVRFGELSDEDHAAIAKFIHTRAPMFYDDD